MQTNCLSHPSESETLITQESNVSLDRLIEDNKRIMFEDFVPQEVYSRLTSPKSENKPIIPLVWMVSYRSQGALQNIRYFENGVKHCALEFPVRVFFSHWTDAIVVSYVPLEAIKEPHVQEWFVTFYEVSVEEAKQRLTQYPKFPYDGRDADLVRAQMLVDGSVQALLKKSYDKLKSMNVPLIEKFPGSTSA